MPVNPQGRKKYLRQIALSLAGRLPEEEEDALYVLKKMAEIVEKFYKLSDTDN